MANEGQNQSIEQQVTGFPESLNPESNPYLTPSEGGRPVDNFADPLLDSVEGEAESAFGR
jgi:hypothetical protein